MKCQYCGAEIQDGAKTCPNCFAPVENMSENVQEDELQPEQSAEVKVPEEAHTVEEVHTVAGDFNPNPFAHSVTQDEDKTFSYQGGPAPYEQPGSQNSAAPHGQPGGMPGDRSDAAPYGRPGGMPSDRSDAAPYGRPDGMPGNQSGSAPYGQPGGMPGSQSGAAPYGRPGGMPGSQSGAAPYGRPGGMPGNQSGAAPYGQPGGMPGSRSDAAPYGRPGGMPGNQSGAAPYGQPGGMPGNQPGAAPYGQPGGLPGNQTSQEKQPYSHGRNYQQAYGGFNQTNIDRMNGKAQKKGSKSTLFIIIGAIALIGVLALIAINAMGSQSSGSGSTQAAATFSFTNKGTPDGTRWKDNIDTVQDALGGEIIGDSEALYLEDVENVENVGEEADVICSFDGGLYDVAVKYDADDQNEYDQLLSSFESRFGTSEDYTFETDNGWSETITSDGGDSITVDLSGSAAKCWDLGNAAVFLTRDSSDNNIVIMSTRFD